MPLQLDHTIVPAYDKVKSAIFLLIFLAEDREAQGDLVEGQVFDVGGDGPVVAEGSAGSATAVFNRGVNPAALDSVVWVGLR